LIIEALERVNEARERGDDRAALEEAVRAMSLDRDPLPQLSAGAWRLKERGYDTAAAELWREAKAQAVEVARVAQELAEQVRSWVERTAERARELLSPPEPELAGSRGRSEETSGASAERLREAWNDREGASLGRGGGGDYGRSDAGESDEGDEDHENTRDLADRLREAAKGIDHDAALERMQDLQREREDYARDLRDERAKDRDEERRHLERERQRDRDRSRGR